MNANNHPIVPNRSKRSAHTLNNFTLIAAILVGVADAKTSIGGIDFYQRINDGVLTYTENPGDDSLTVERPYEWPDGGVQDLEIPEAVMLNGSLRPVTAVGSQAFDSVSYTHNEINGKLTLPPSITLIKDRAFRGNMMPEIVLPDSVKSIGSSAFGSCSNLTTIKIPTGVVSISDSVFEDCSGLESVTFHSAIKTIGSNAFSGCIALAGINLPSKLTTIGENAFSECSSLVALSLPGKVVTISGEAFSGCSSLERVTIPASTSDIGMSAFSPCIRLRQVSFLGGLPSVHPGYGGFGSSFPDDNPNSITIFCIPHKGFEDVFDDATHYRIKYLAPDLLVSTSGGKVIKNDGKAIYLGSARKDTKGNIASLRVKNTGLKPLHIRKVRLSGKGKTSFKILSSPKSTIAPGASSTLRVRFQPLVKGEASATAIITCDDPFEGTYRIRLSGMGK